MIDLAIHHPPVFWPNLKWTDFAAMPNKERVVCVLPVTGFLQVDRDLPLDALETVATTLLRDAAQSAGFPLLVLPPLRFMPGPAGSGAFAPGVPLAHRLIEEFAAGVGRSGFGKLVLFNACRENEPLIDAAARDIRISHGLQMFCLNLGGLGLSTGKDDVPGGRRLHAVARFLCGRGEPDDGSGQRILGEEARHLHDLLEEIDRRAPLPAGGRIPGKEER